MSRAEPTRRSVLAALGLLAVAGCDVGEEPQPLPTRPDPDSALRREAADDVRQLVASHEATLLAHPALGTALRPMLSDHRVHLRALQGGRARSGATRMPSSPTSPAPPVPATPRAAQDALARSEQDAADRRVAQLATASPRLAKLLAAIGASDAAHSALLRDAT